MSIRMRIEGNSAINLDEETITLGSDSTCTVPFPAVNGLHPKHAVIRKLAGRWIVEVRNADFIRVGDGEPTRLHWLSPGDVIRLADGCPTITFEPGDSGPVATSAAPAVTSPSVAGFVRPTLRTAGTETAQSGLSGPQSMAEVTSQPRSVSISSFETADGDVLSRPAARPLKADNVAGAEAGPAPDTLKRELQRRDVQQGDSDSRREAESSFVASPDDPPVNVKPIPISSWFGTSEAAEAAAREDRARKVFWLQVAGGALLGGIAMTVLLVVLQGGRARKPAPVPDASIEVPKRQTAPSAYVVNSKAKPDAGAKTLATPKKDDSTESAKSPDASPTDAPQTMPPASPKVADASAISSGAAPSPTPSATFQAAREGVFAVYAQHSDPSHCFRIGTAWAATRRHLVTSGAVAMALDDLQQRGLKIVVSQPGADHPIPVKSIRVNPAYKAAVDRATAARQKLDAASEARRPAGNDDETNVSPDVELARAFADQARFDLGVLEIAMGERLKYLLKMESRDLPDVASTDFTLIGFPFPGDDYRTSSSAATDPPQERSCVAKSAVKSESNLTLAMGFPGDVADGNWSGSPVFDQNQRVIGVYSRATTPGKEGDAPRRHAITWLGRLREFAPDLE